MHWWHSTFSWCNWFGGTPKHIEHWLFVHNDVSVSKRLFKISSTDCCNNVVFLVSPQNFNLSMFSLEWFPATHGLSHLQQMNVSRLFELTIRHDNAWYFWVCYKITVYRDWLGAFFFDQFVPLSCAPTIGTYYPLFLFAQNARTFVHRSLPNMTCGRVQFVFHHIFVVLHR